MPAPINRFKQALKTGPAQIGLWLGLANPYVAEICARRGFDWLVIDNEHAPNDLQSTLAQIQAMADTDAEPVVRVPIGEDWMLKQMLDASAQTVLVPMIDTPEQAAAMVRAVRYPPHGVRGVGAALGRASHWNAIEDYIHTANDQICLLVQIESALAMKNAAAIAAIDGVDGVFIGPADLSADMGFLGNPTAPEVIAAIEAGIKDILAAGKAPGILWPADDAQRWIDQGARFVAIGADALVMSAGVKALRAQFA
jgi:4-hydroxy-2-oxoheptanedioate aldolase